MRLIGSATPARSFDDLWREAEAIGRTSVEKAVFGDDYRATISFKNGQSHIAAYGTDPDRYTALLNAIVEARRLGA